MGKLVCDINNNECIVLRCTECPGTDSLKTLLDEELSEIDEEEDFSI